MIVQKTSLFPANRDVVFQKLQQLETLQYIAKPYATFEPIGETVSMWTVGSTSSYRFWLFGVIPFGTHTIHIVRFDQSGVSSREGNEYVPVWNHDIKMEPINTNHTRYSDRVEIHAGWKTVFIWFMGECILCPQAKEMDQSSSKKHEGGAQAMSISLCLMKRLLKAMKIKESYDVCLQHY